MSVDPNARRAWLGSLVFTTAASMTAFLLFGLPALASEGQVGFATLVVFSISFGLAIECARRMKLAMLKRKLDRADASYVMRVEINGVHVGAIPEPRYASLRMACSNDPRNYLVWFRDLIGALWRHAVFTFSVTVAFAGLYLVAACLIDPEDAAQAILACLSASQGHAGSASALGTALHAVASVLVNLFVLLYLTLGGARMTFNPNLSMVQAFQDDLHRRIRLALNIPAAGYMTVRRARAS